MVEIWDVKTLKKVRTIPEQNGWFGSLAFVGNDLLAVGRSDTTIHLWDVSDLRAPR